MTEPSCNFVAIIIRVIRGFLLLLFFIIYLASLPLPIIRVNRKVSPPQVFSVFCFTHLDFGNLARRSFSEDGLNLFRISDLVLRISSSLPPYLLYPYLLATNF